jgi:hypothetical protein
VSAKRVLAANRIGFVADSRGNVAEIVMSDAVSDAWDILTAAGMPSQKAADMAVAAERSGRDPVAFAEHFAKVARTLGRPA